MGTYVDFMADSIEVSHRHGEEYSSLKIQDACDNQRSCVVIFVKDAGLVEAIAKAAAEYKAKQNLVANVPVINILEAMR